MERHETVTTTPIKPQLLAAELRKHLAPDAIVNCDSGSVTVWWARHVLVKRGQSHTVSGNLASTACGLPYAIAAQIAYPHRQCVAFVGDGRFTMLMGELATAAHACVGVGSSGGTLRRGPREGHSGPGKIIEGRF